MLQLIHESDNLEKTRKSLWAASIYTVLVSNATFHSDQVDLFGLQVSVSQTDLISLGRLTLSFLLIVFLIRCSVVSTNWHSKRIENQYDQWEGKVRGEIQEIVEQETGEHKGDWSDYADPWDVHFRDQSTIRRSNVEKIARRTELYSKLVDFLVRYALTLFVSLATLFNPRMFRTLLDFFAFS